MQNSDGQTIESHSISAGLDYPGVGPEHSHLSQIGRAEYRPVTDVQAMDAFAQLCRTEGIIPAIESAHAVAGAAQLAADGVEVILVNVSGRGDKDVDTAARWFGLLGGGAPPDAGVDGYRADDDGEGALADGGVGMSGSSCSKVSCRGPGGTDRLLPGGLFDHRGLDRGGGRWSVVVT